MSKEDDILISKGYMRGADGRLIPPPFTKEFDEFMAAEEAAGVHSLKLPSGIPQKYLHRIPEELRHSHHVVSVKDNELSRQQLQRLTQKITRTVKVIGRDGLKREKQVTTYGLPNIVHKRIGLLHERLPQAAIIDYSDNEETGERKIVFRKATGTVEISARINDNLSIQNASIQFVSNRGREERGTVNSSYYGTMPMLTAFVSDGPNYPVNTRGTADQIIQLIRKYAAISSGAPGRRVIPFTKTT